MQRFSIHTLGCKVNQVESDSMAAMLLEQGYLAADVNCDFVVINGCAVTETAEKKSKQVVARIKRESPAAKIIFTGCAADKLSAEQKNDLQCDYVIKNSDKHNIPEIIRDIVNGLSVWKTDTDDLTFPEYSFSSYPRLRTRAFIKIQDGCDNFCSYCIIPYLRGNIRSRSITSIIREVQLATAAGFREIVLTGIHLGNYGKETGFELRLEDVVERVINETGIERIRLGSIESPEISDRLLELFASEQRLCRHLHLPLQSGSDATLRRMNRNYQARDYRMLVEQIIRQLPDVAITADVIVGFPGESEAEFNETCTFLKELPLAGLHVFPFSRRQGTTAYALPEQIDGKIKKQRVKAVTLIGNQLRNDFLVTNTGRTTTVLFESETDGVSFGYSENYQKIYLLRDNLAGKVVRVKLVGSFRDGMLGEFLEQD